jgi:general secretion pathway protein K
LSAPLAESAATSGRFAAADERGFALLFVIWVLALLAVLAATLGVVTRTEATIAHNRVELARARGIAEAGVTLAEYSMLDSALATQWHADGSARIEAYGGGSVTITLQDEAGKIDLNAAPLELIAGLIAVLDIDDGAALAHEIVDRRAAFAEPAGPPRGAAPGGFTNRLRGGGVAFDMRRMPFATVAELRLLPGMTRPAYERIRPFVTVYSASAKINPLTAPSEVLLSVPGVSPQEVGFLLAARAHGSEPTGVGVPTLSGADRYVEPGNLRAVTIRAFAVTDAGGNFEREAVVMMTDVPLRPIRFVEWRQGLDETPGRGE